MKKRDFHKKKRLKWPLIWLLQAAAMLALSLLAELSMLLGGFVYKICLWGLVPLAGFISACLATRAGLLNYAAWIAPPAMEFLAVWLLWGYAPSAGPVFLCGFVSLVGAATGEVLKRATRG